ncbi:MAG: hypothetical protein QM660_14780, partial [Dysgonomonas sp.]
MKKYIYTILLSTLLLLSACGSYQTANVRNLSVGMTQSEVNQIMGYPVRVLSTNYSSDGVQEVFEYVNYQNESYAIEFWNEHLVGFDFMYRNSDPIYRPSSPSPVYPVEPDRPNYRPNNRPSTRPSRPSGSTKPSRPDSSSRPSGSGSSSSRPSTSTRPNESGSSSSRPSTSTKPSESGSSSSRPSTS